MSDGKKKIGLCKNNSRNLLHQNCDKSYDTKLIAIKNFSHTTRACDLGWLGTQHN